MHLRDHVFIQWHHFYCRPGGDRQENFFSNFTMITMEKYLHHHETNSLDYMSKTMQNRKPHHDHMFHDKLTSFSVFVSAHVIDRGSSSSFISVCSFSLSENVGYVSSHEMCWSSVASKLCWKNIMIMSLIKGMPYFNTQICISSIYI